MDKKPLTAEEWEELYGSLRYGRHGTPDLTTYSEEPEPHVMLWFGAYYVRCPAPDHPAVRDDPGGMQEAARPNVIRILDEQKYAKETN